MAVTENSYTGNGSTTNYSFTFPYLKSTDVQVQVDATVTTAWSFANATTVQFNTAPSNGAKIKILRDTNVDSLAATFYAGSSIKSEDLNDNYTQNLYKTQEVGNRYFSNTGGTMTGDLTLGEDVTLTFEGATDNANETKLTVADPTADRTITLPDVSGTVVTTGDTGTVATSMIAADAVNGTKIADDSINSEHYVDGSIDTQHIANAQVTTAKIADDNITTAKIASSAVTNTELANNAVQTGNIVDSNVTNAKLADDSVTTAKIADNSISTALIQNDAVTADKLAHTSVTAGSYSAADITVDAQGRVTAASNGAIATSEITDSAVTTAKINDDAVTSAKIATDAVIAGKIGTSAVTTNKIQDDAVTNAKLAVDAVGASQLATSSVTTNKIANSAVTAGKIATDAVTSGKIANDAVTNAKIAANAVDSNEIGSGVIDTVHIGSAQITDAKLASNAVTTAKITDANVTTAKIANDAITIGKIGCEQTTISDSDSHIPTSGAVVDYVAAQLAPLGGLEVIATEVAFPNTQPSAGVVISIADAGGIVVNGSGTSTTGRTVGGSTVTINNINSAFNSSTVDAGVSFMVSSTGSGQVYNFHKATLKEADIINLSNDINDFGNRYRVSSSAPTSSLDNGDLWFDTANGKMMVYNGINTAWEEVSAIGSFNINTISSSGNTGGGSATFNNNAYRFTLSNPPQNAQQLLVSINGVIQKPNSGTSQPSEGFAISGNDIIFSSAPASGSDYFIITLGQSVEIGTPSDNTVSTAKLVNDAVTNAKIAAGAVGSTELAANAVITSKIPDAAVTTAKIADDAVTTAKIAKPLDFADNEKARFGTGNDLQIWHDGSLGSYIDNSYGYLYLRGDSASTIRIQPVPGENSLMCRPNGAVELYYDNVKKLETSNTGTTTTGTSQLDGDVKFTVSGNASGRHKFIGGGTNKLELGTYSSNNTSRDVHLKIEPGGSIEIPADNQKLQFGAGQDLEIYHNGTTNVIAGANTASDINIEAFTGAGVNLISNGNHYAVKCVSNAQVELYYDNVKKFETVTGGVYVYGDLLFGVGTTANLYGGDGDKIILGSGSDFQIYHNGTSNIIEATTGDLNIRMNNSENAIVARQNGAVEVYHDNAKKFETTSAGANFLDNVKWSDNKGARFGGGEDLQLYHDGGSWNYIKSQNSKNLAIQVNDENAIIAVPDSEVALYYDNGKKLQTVSNGVIIDNTCRIENINNKVGSMVSAVNNLEFKVHQTNGQSALQAAVISKGVSGWGGELEFYTKPADSNPSGNLAHKATLDENGCFQVHSQPYAMASRGGANQSVSNNSGTIIAFNQEHHDQNSDYNTSNYRFTAPVDGVYQVNITVQYTGNINLVHAGLYRNGGNPGINGTFDPWCNWGDDTRAASFVHAIYCSAGDYLEAVTYQSSGGTRTLEQNRTKWTVYLLG